MNNITRLQIVFCAVLVMLPVHIARAAEVFFTAATEEVKVGQLVRVEMALDSENEKINAVSGALVFSEENLALKAVEDGGSIINFWIDRSVVKEGRATMFSGITPGGYQGNKGNLLSFVFEAIKPGSAQISLNKGQVLLNDGTGSEANLKISDIKIRIIENSENKPAEIYRPADAVPPQDFVIQIVQDARIAENKWMAVFASQDKETGVAYYQVQEAKENKINEQNWQIAESPFVLQDQSRSSYVFVKAVDRNGNFKISTIDPRVGFKYERGKIYGILMIISALILFTGLSLWRKKIKQKRKLL
jgi:hypothetical protein